MTTEARVLAHGLACPLGLRAGAALAALHAGISRFTESEQVVDAAGDAARGAMLRQLDPAASRTERAVFFARHAFSEVARPLASSGLAVLPCFLAWPEPGFGPALDLGLVQRGLAEVARAAGGAYTLELRPERLFAAGRAGAFAAVRAALDAFERDDCRIAVVGGLDSRVDPSTLRALADADRLLGRRNPDGLLPGEGAAFLVLVSPRAATTDRTLARLTGFALAREPHPRGHGGPYVGDGLTGVFRALQVRHPGRVDVVFSAQTGEGCYGRAFAYAYLRAAALMPEPLRQVVLGALLGDAGAAAGAIALAAAVAGLHFGPQPGQPTRYRTALVYGESDDGTVGGSIVEAAEARRRA